MSPDLRGPTFCERNGNGVDSRLLFIWEELAEHFPPPPISFIPSFFAVVWGGGGNTTYIGLVGESPSRGLLLLLLVLLQVELFLCFLEDQRKKERNLCKNLVGILPMLRLLGEFLKCGCQA